MKVWESQKDWEGIMRKVIIAIEIVTIILLIAATPTEEAGAIKEIGEIEVKGQQPDLITEIKEKIPEEDYFIMTTTAYTTHPKCISNKWNDGKTAIMTPIREGVVAINVDYINGEWKVKSPLRLGDKIYIEGMGYYSVEDTGRFSERNQRQDIWTLDIYVNDYQSALEYGRKLKKVYVLDEEENNGK